MRLEYRQEGEQVRFFCRDDFDPEKIFECGQCFRWNADPDGSYTGVARGLAVRIRRDGDSLLITGTEEQFEKIWYDYFDLGRNYAAIRASLARDGYMREASGFGAGIRILHQDSWEGLCSFILSQCNNIPRIKQIVEALCRRYGRAVRLEDKICYTFPDAATVAGLTEEDLAPVRCGYRARYILAAARQICEGKLDLESLAAGSCEAARTALKQLDGVGDKVANCVLLFGLHGLSAFPVDVWMKRALEQHYGRNFDPAVFGKYAGIAQQYMFYYQRCGQAQLMA